MRIGLVSLHSSVQRPTRRRHWCARRGIAATEMAIIAPILLILLMGLWEIGRYVQMQSVLDSATREAGRLAASGAYFSSDNHNAATAPNAAYTLPPPSANADYEVQKRVKVYLEGARVNTTGMTVTVTNLGSASAAKDWSYTYVPNGTSSGTGYDPSAAAAQLDKLTVTVTIPYANVTWSSLSFFVSQSATMSSTATWYSMVNTPLTVNTSIITKPLQSTDNVP